jgi:ribosomal protein S14
MIIMKKLLEKDKKLRGNFTIIENKHFILKSISKNLNYMTLIRWNALKKINLLTKQSSKVSTVNRCLYSINKKRFSKLTGFSRHIFLKVIRAGLIPGMTKSSW